MNKRNQRRIRLELAGKGITLAEIGRRCEPPVSRQYVHMTLSGLRAPARVRAAIAEALGWNPWADDKAGAA